MNPAPHHRIERIADGWETVRDILRILLNLWGSPAALLELRLLPRAWRGELLAWLRPAEALVRRLLLIRAAEIAPTLPPRKIVARAKKARTPRPPPPRATPPEETAAWARVRFKVLLGVRGRHGVRRGGPSPLEPVTALVFAERLEALIRAVHAPERLAQRLARRMQAAKGKAARGSRDDLVARLLRPTMDTPANPAREAMKQLAPYTDEADRYFSSA